MFSSVFQNAPFFFEWVTYEVAYGYINEVYNTPEFKGFALEYDNEIVGYCLGVYNLHLLEKQYHIKEIFVSNNMQNKGVGTKLLELVENYLKENGTDNITLHTNKNIPAYQFYINKSYEQIIDSVHLMKKL